MILRRQRLGHAQHGDDAFLHGPEQQVTAKIPRLDHPQRLCRVAQFRHDQRAEVLGLLELPQRLAQLIGEQILAHHGGHVLHLGIGKGHVLQHTDVGLRLHPQESPPPQPCRRLHRQRKGSQRARAVINLHPGQVVRQDQRGDFCRVITLFLVDGVEQVKGIGQHVPRARRRIADADIFGAGDLQEVRLGLFGGDVIVHPFGQTAARSVQQPEPPQRVLDQVAHDPVRGEELGGGRDVLGRDLLVLLQPREDLILLLGDVELVEPTNDLDILTGVLGHNLAQLGKYRRLRQQILRHQEFGVIVKLFEQERHRPVPLVAGMHQKLSISFALRIRRRRATIKQRRDAARRALRQVPRHRLGKDLGACLPLSRRNNPDRRVAIRIHEAQRCEAVEPCVGHLLNHLCLAIPRDRSVELFHCLRMFPPRGRGRIKHKIKLGANLFDQQITGGLGKLLQRVRVHQTITFLPARICSSRVFFISWTYCSTSASSVR
ncbi:hypothetical protein TL5118_00987 [Thalassovita autumnalis]|uniref:Uncharacterized protein n=1 Tax=Thalassovita autumnalis TaxID=2072972 RepID=A0ABM9UJU1_9RHOB|nr:hypothetical protein TL5118_00987 [Thalassovita autumnalis]